MAQPDGKHGTVVALLTVLQRRKHFVCCQKATQIVLPPETDQIKLNQQYLELITD